jgi:prophage tail gpP-like protein
MGSIKPDCKSFSLNATVLNWKDESGVLWDINQLIRVKSSYLGVNEELLSAGVNYKKSNGGGTVSSIKFIRPDAYTPKPVFNKTEAFDINKALGKNFQK